MSCKNLNVTTLKRFQKHKKKQIDNLAGIVKISNQSEKIMSNFLAIKSLVVGTQTERQVAIFHELSCNWFQVKEVIILKKMILIKTLLNYCDRQVSFSCEKYKTNMTQNLSNGNFSEDFASKCS